MDLCLYNAATKNCNLPPPLYCIRYRRIMMSDRVNDGGNLQWYPANIFVRTVLILAYTIHCANTMMMMTLQARMLVSS